MKAIVATAMIALSLTLCNLMNRRASEQANTNTNSKQGTLSVTDAPATKEAAVKARAKELFELCKAGRNAEAAPMIARGGLDPNRPITEVARYEDIEGKYHVDLVCGSIKKTLDESNGYEFREFKTESKTDGREVAIIDVSFRRGPVSNESIYVAEIYAFTLVDGNYALIYPYRRPVDVAAVPPASITPRSIISSANSNSGVPQLTSEPPPPPKAPTPGAPKTISGGVLNGKAISKPQPAYPAIAKAAKASGTVVVQVLVDEQGNVISARAVSGHPLLQQSAVAAARQAKFSPTMLSGQPVKVTGVITYNFVAQ